MNIGKQGIKAVIVLYAEKEDINEQENRRKD